MQTMANIETTSAKRYLGQFAKHFAHKIPVELAEDNISGTVHFPMGNCEMQADAAQLTLRLDAAKDAMPQLMDVVVRHLVRFAFREELQINWEQVPA